MTLDAIRENRPLQTALGLVFGVLFGFLLERGGATDHAVIWGQLLLYDFTVVKIMLSAVIVGTLGFHLLHAYGIAERRVAAPSIGTHLVGGLIFGLGFGLLGLCPGTVAGAVGRGSLDALLAGVVGLLIGTRLFASYYPQIHPRAARAGPLPWKTLPEMLGGISPWPVIGVLVVVVLALFWVLEVLGI
ncbi:MAG: YeeE/YedE family protein [Methanospirillum sp.]|nr:YeeE/YedE family protein [Methanospirillum sp.]